MGEEEELTPGEIFSRQVLYQETMREKAHMHAEEFVASLNRFLKEAPNEHLITLHKLMRNIMMLPPDGVRESVSFFDGELIAILTFVRTVCLECGENHLDTLMSCEEFSHKPDPTNEADL